MKNLLICKKACPIVGDLKMENAELRHDKENMRIDIKNLLKQIDLLITDNNMLEARVEKLEKSNAALAAREAFEQKRLAKIRQVAMGYLDPEAPECG